MVAASFCKHYTVLYHNIVYGIILAYTTLFYILICNIRLYCLHPFTYKDCTHKKAFIL